MGISSKPIAFALLSVAVILVGTIITTIVPIFMPSTQPVSDYIKPYTAIEIEGRDIYIREGCNNCHTQTVRPIRTEVARYGEYSKPEEFAYDRPFLWGSRRTGPDLNRAGGKYPDSWHYKHTVDPQSMFPRSNMPPYRWLAGSKLCTDYSYKKASVLGYGFTEQEVHDHLNNYKDMVTSAGYSSRDARNDVTPEGMRDELTELDALVAYIQKLGADVKALKKKETAVVAEAATPSGIKNPFEGNKAAISKGREIFQKNCALCHGADGTGGIGLNLTDKEWKYGSSDGDLYETVSKGRPGGMPNFEASLGKENVWKVISYIRSLGK